MDLKVVGAGHLGVRIAELWKEEFPDSIIYLKTKRNDNERNTKWSSLGFEPLSEETENESNRVKTPFVVFCAPPTNNPNYCQDVETAIKKDWDSELLDDSAFVFTASGGVYAENSGGKISETSELSQASERSKALLSAEKRVEENGGISIRFGGLYTKTRGAHNFWLDGKNKEFAACPNGLINLVHYDDAAKCVLEALLKTPDQDKNSSPKLFLVSDGVPISRENICKAALKCPIYGDRCIPKFTGDENNIDGKAYDTSLAHKVLDWKPHFGSFAEFMSNHFDEEINVEKFW